MSTRAIYSLLTIVVLAAVVLGGIALYRIGHPTIVPIENTWDMYGDVPWQGEHNMDLARALVGARIRGCGIMDWKPNAEKAGRYLVACSQEGKFWQGYEVTLRMGKSPVVTPFNDFLTIIPPRN